MENINYSLLEKKGISIAQLNEQLSSFRNGFPFLNIEKAAEIGDGILALSEEQAQLYTSIWNQYLSTDKDIVKFVPASGAASRMFKDLFEFIEAEYTNPTNVFEVKFFENLAKFAFFDDLNQAIFKNTSKDIKSLIDKKDYKAIVSNLLDSTGLNYGNLPKGLLKFHKYNNENRTPLEEHLVEGALYAKNARSIVNVHFTVSSEHKDLFKKHVNEVTDKYAKEYNVHFNISFSEQKPSTDTVAADENNEPFIEKGSILFRPGGHGALIENLNDLDADIVFIKNIDNVVPDSIKATTVEYKKLIAGILVDLQTKSFNYLELLENKNINEAKLSEIVRFSDKELSNKNSNIDLLDKEELISYLKAKLNRPIRVCGMVKNVGEPGGGPYLIVNKDGSISPQILESSQINMKDERSVNIMKTATHFNPVDLVCGIKDYKGNKFDLTKFVDKNTGFISSKSKNGKELKALELPGLWNGAMSDWNTIFVEVPILTFNPVKTVNDLLRDEHQQ